MSHKPPVQAAGRQKADTAGSDEKRERILRAAEALFDAQGYANTTIEQIVQKLGVTKPFVYYYFRNKQEIFETLSWAPTVACFTAMDFDEGDVRPAHVKVTEGIARLIGQAVGSLMQEKGQRSIVRCTAPNTWRRKSSWPTTFTTSCAPCSKPGGRTACSTSTTPRSPRWRPAACRAFSTTGTGPMAACRATKWHKS